MRHTSIMQRTALWLALFLTANICFALDVQPEQGTGWTNKKSVRAEKFIVTTAHPVATETGYKVLNTGGNAIDAAVAVQFVLNLVEPQSSGIGGGAFALYWDAKNKSLSSWDGRETAPAAATPDYFLDENDEPGDWWETVTGGRSVGVPGTLKMLHELHQNFGVRPWKELIQPAIDLAEDGFEVTPRLNQSIAAAAGKGLTNFDTTREYFFNTDGTPLATGSVLKNPDFAATLQLIARHGSTPFYRGAIAEDIVAAVHSTKDNPGILTKDDFAGYKVKQREPVCVDYRGYSVCGMGPPSSGGLTVGQILGILSNFDPGVQPNAKVIHLYNEAAKLAYADRALYMADSDFVAMPLAGLTDPGYLKQRAVLIDNNRAMSEATAGEPPWQQAQIYAPDMQEERPGTSHFSIVDQQGNALSMTTTIETGFGSRLTARGFLLNNELTDFSWEPEKDGIPVANRVEGGKRPRSSMAPTIVFDADGEPYMLIGSPGGSRIINYVAKTLIAVLDWNMDIQDAINLGHFVNRNGATDLEQNTEASSWSAALQALGHETKLRDLNSGLHGIVITKDGLIGGADPRREGLVLGD
ncbi:MAG: gamma-glutamyltransferase [Gammaproteobacteria bacterium]|nr:gamma-glutamyltransferase [Gammaproteobacteria bacterium]